MSQPICQFEDRLTNALNAASPQGDGAQQHSHDVGAPTHSHDHMGGTWTPDEHGHTHEHLEDAGTFHQDKSTVNY